MDDREIRLRLVEAAARFPVPHKDGFAAGALEAAQKWEAFVLGKNSGEMSPGAFEAAAVKVYEANRTLKLPKK